MNTVHVQVPATSANCGPGFDCFRFGTQIIQYFLALHLM